MLGMDINEMLDHHEIIALTHAYCWALDRNRYDELDDVFLPDATAHLGGLDLVGRDAIKARIDRALTRLDDSQHIVATHQIKVTGDTATCRCYLHAQHVMRDAVGGPHYIVAGRYEDRLVRTPDGWRIAHRDLLVMWTEGNGDVTRGSRSSS